MNGQKPKVDGPSRLNVDGPKTESKRFQSNESGRSQSTDFFSITYIFTSCFTLESECESDHEEAFVSEIIF